jgi:hypothetical protein
LNWWIQKIKFCGFDQKYDTFDTIQKKVGTSNKLLLDQWILILYQLNPKLKTKIGSGTLVK